MTYLRFVIPAIDCDSGHPAGIFVAAYELIEQPDTPQWVCRLLQDHIDWFKDNLHIPDSFSRSKNADARPRAICWFRSSANDCIARAREMNAILNEFGFPVSQITTQRPGFVVYEDKYQIAAVPFRR